MGNYRRRPTRMVVEDAIYRAALNDGLTSDDVLHGRRRCDSAARRDAWMAILDDSGCSVAGLAHVWGIDRQAIHRVKRARERVA